MTDPNVKAQVLAPAAGEELRLRPPRRSGRVTIKVDRRNGGATAFSMGTQELIPGGRIPLHLHERQEEVLFVHRGEGYAVLPDKRITIGPGSTVHVPPGVWHGIENGTGGPMELVWFIAPPGLEGMFREIGTAPGVEPEPLSDSEFRRIVRRHGMRLGGPNGGEARGTGEGA